MFDDQTIATALVVSIMIVTMLFASLIIFEYDFTHSRRKKLSVKEMAELKRGKQYITRGSECPTRDYERYHVRNKTVG